MAEKDCYAEEEEDEENVNLLADVFIGEGNCEIWNCVSMIRGEELVGGTYRL